MNTKIKVIIIAALLVLMLSLTSAPTTASVGYSPGMIEPGPYTLPACWCDMYPVECYCKTKR